MKKKIASVIKFLIFLGIGIAFIWLFMRNLSQGEKNDILNSLKTANYSWILLSMVFGILSHFSRTLRWKILLETMGYKPRLKNVFLSVFIAYFANLALPRLGEVSRCGVLAKYEKIPFQKSFGTVVVERALDMLVFLLLFFVNFAIQFKRLHAYVDQKIVGRMAEKFNGLGVYYYFWWFLLALIVTTIILLIVFRKPLMRWKPFAKLVDIIKGFWEGIKSLGRIKRPLAFFTHTFIIWFMYLMMTYIVFRCIPETAHLGIDAGFAVLIFASIGIMLVQGGIGIYPAIVAETLFVYSIPETIGYAMGWLLWTGQTIMLILAGIISIVLLPLLNPPANQTDMSLTDSAIQSEE